MIYSLEGELIHRELNMAVVRCGGIGFRCRITGNTFRHLPGVGEPVMLYTIMDVRDDAIELFGFYDRQELDCYKQLTAITGVGPKAGIAILSEMSPQKVALAVAAGDYKALTRAPGIGPKLAQRIILEMKDKVADFGGESSQWAPVSMAGNAAQACQALTVLGFSQSEAAAAVGKLDETLPVEELVRQALKMFAKT